MERNKMNRKKQYLAKNGRRMHDNNGYASPMWKAYWEKVDRQEALRQLRELYPMSTFEE